MFYTEEKDSNLYSLVWVYTNRYDVFWCKQSVNVEGLHSFIHSFGRTYVFFFVSAAEVTWSPETGIWWHGAVTLIHRNTDDVKSLNIQFINRQTVARSWRLSQFDFPDYMYSCWIFICNHVDIALIYSKKVLSIR